jgi:TonB-linked SusC/RagA family outer membrane protein
MRRILLTYIIPAFLLFAGTHSSMAQDSVFILTGMVYSSETGNPLADINIRSVTPGFQPVSTDSTGHFEIKLPGKNDQILVSYPGYKQKQIYVDGCRNIKIWLLNAEDFSLDDPVQLIGKKVPGTEIVGAVSTGQFLELTKSSRQSVDQLLQGKIPGVFSVNRSGMPGEGAFLHIRGYNSLFSKGMPLVILDGMIIRNEGFPNSIINGYYQNPLADINLNDIASITVLKDAVETAPYGIKGSNGVIIINTNPPESGKTTLDVAVSGGISSLNRQIPVMTEGPYKSYLMEQMYGAGLTSEGVFTRYPFMEGNPDYLYFEKYNNSTNWQDEIFSTGILTDANLRVKGGDERAMYSLSTGFLKNNGIVNNTSYSRFNFRFNSIVKVSPKVNIGINLRFSNSKYSLMESGSLYQTNPLYASLIKAPNLSVFQQNREGIDQPISEDKDIFGFSNPYVLVTKIDANNTGFGFLGSSYLEYRPSERLTIYLGFGLTRDKTNERLFNPAWGIAPQGNGSAMRSMKNKVDQSISVLNENRINYSILLNQVHSLSVDVGSHLFLNHITQNYGMAQNSATDEFRNLDAGRSDERQVGGYDENWNWLDYYATLNYRLKGRYLLSLNTSLDGSSRFGRKVKGDVDLMGYPFALSHSVGAAWIVSREPFLRDLTFLSELKLRASTGLGGSDEFGNYASRFKYISIPYYSVTGFYLGGISNQNLRWERIRRTNFGIDLALLRERINISLDHYTFTTTDMISYIDLPGFYGYNQYLTNSGECENTGWDLNAGFRVLNRAVKWDLNFSYSMYRNQIVSLENGSVLTKFIGGEKISSEGEAFGMFYGYKSLGVFKSQSDADAANLVDKAGRRFNAGDIHFADLDGNNIINEDDRTIIGNPHPDYVAGIYSKISYHGFSLDAQINIVEGNTVFNYMRSKIESMDGFENQSTAVYNRWVKDGQETEMPRAAYGDPMGNARFSNRWLEDGSFVRLSNLTLSYAHPKKLFFTDYFTIFITGTNLFTWTRYLGYDPEFSFADGALGQGIDYGQMPQSRSVLIGIKLGL